MFALVLSIFYFYWIKVINRDSKVMHSVSSCSFLSVFESYKVVNILKPCAAIAALETQWVGSWWLLGRESYRFQYVLQTHDQLGGLMNASVLSFCDTVENETFDDSLKSRCLIIWLISKCVTVFKILDSCLCFSTWALRVLHTACIIHTFIFGSFGTQFGAARDQTNNFTQFLQQVFILGCFS